MRNPIKGAPVVESVTRIDFALETGKRSLKLPPIKTGVSGLGEATHSLRFPPKSKCWKGPMSAELVSAGIIWS